MNEDEIQSIIDSAYENFILDNSDPCYKASLNPHWKYEQIPLNQIINSYKADSEVQEWFNQEVNLWEMENPGEPNRWQELEKYFINNSTELPLIVLSGSDEKYYLNDGHHRYAIALKNKMNQVWVISVYP